MEVKQLISIYFIVTNGEIELLLPVGLEDVISMAIGEIIFEMKDVESYLELHHPERIKELKPIANYEQALLIDLLEDNGFETKLKADFKTNTLKVSLYHESETWGRNTHHQNEISLGYLSYMLKEYYKGDEGYMYTQLGLFKKLLKDFIKQYGINNSTLANHIGGRIVYDKPNVITKIYDTTIDPPYPYTIVVNKRSYFYADSESRDEDFEKLKVLLYVKD